MKLKSISKWPMLTIFFVAISALVLISWDQKQDTPRSHQQITNDTIPQKKVRDLDEMIDELERVEIEQTMEKAMKEVQEAMKKIDMEKLKVQMNMAMKEVDMAKIQKEVQESMSKIDWEKMNKEIKEAMKEIDMTRIQKEVQESMAKVDWQKVQKELEEVKVNNEEIKEEMEKVKEEMKKIKPEIEKELQKAKVEIEKAKAEMKEYKAFVDGLENDGLINKKENYTIEHKNGKLTVNGKEANAKTYSKYKNFLEKHKEFTIKKDGDDFDIDID